MEKFNELINGKTPVLVDFFATWCGPCKMMHPVLEDLKKQMGDKVHILKVDIDVPSNRQIVAAHQIQSVPTLMIFKEGKMLWRESGASPVTRLKEMLEKYI